MATQASDRGRFGSGLGFILAAAGSAIGLGNIWGFPYMAAQSGGGAFVLLYVLCVAFIGIPVLFSELSIGRAAQRSPVGAFKRLAPGTPWIAVGGMGVAIGFAILAFYSVIAGWTLGYLFKAITGQFLHDITMEESTAAFDAFRGSAWQAGLATAVFFVLTIVVVRGGIRGGIERISKVLMPVFFVLLVFIAVRAVTLDGGLEGVRFLFHADFSKLTGSVVMNALAQAMFSMSLGMGAMITYGSYLSRRENLVRSGIVVAGFDTLIALLSGLMIFPALFAAGAEPAGDTGLVFNVLPTIFNHLPAGGLFSIAFYLLLSIAALTSSISLLEVVVSYFVDERGWSRERSTWLLAAACFLLALPSAIWSGFMDLLIQVFYVYLLAFGAFFICIFAGWRWGVAGSGEELRTGGGSSALVAFWGVLIRFFCPVVVGLILVQRVLALFDVSLF
jgi:NSS family neurotransmitter:Na+ symporter